MNMTDKWLQWARRIQAISQSGLHFSKDAFDMARYEELRQISAEIIADYSGVDMKAVNILFALEKGYQTPKMDVRGAVFKDNKILLVRERIDDSRYRQGLFCDVDCKDNKILVVRERIDDRWSLPGGFCEVGVSPSENVIKETQEESGYDVKAQKLLAVLDMHKHDHPPQPYHYYKTFIQCEIVGGKPATSLETKDVHFFPKDQLPKLSTGRNTEAQIHMLFEFNCNPTKQAIVD